MSAYYTSMFGTACMMLLNMNPTRTTTSHNIQRLNHWIEDKNMKTYEFLLIYMWKWKRLPCSLQHNITKRILKIFIYCQCAYISKNKKERKNGGRMPDTFPVLFTLFTKADYFVRLRHSLKSISNMPCIKQSRYWCNENSFCSNSRV